MGAAFGIGVSANTSGGWPVDHWSIEQGLPNNALSDILQTSDGYLWIATWAGVFRFDGIRFTPLAGSLPNNHARVLLDDPDGSVWIGLGGGGLVRWRDGSSETMVAAEDLGGHDVRALARGSDGRVWIGTENAVSVLESGRITRLGGRHGLVEGAGGALAEGRDGQMWIATTAGICEARGIQLQCLPRAVVGQPNAVFVHSARVPRVARPVPPVHAQDLVVFRMEVRRDCVTRPVAFPLRPARGPDLSSAVVQGSLVVFVQRSESLSRRASAARHSGL